MLSTGCEEKLRDWLSTETWHTSHPLDMGRWYDFVAQHARDHGHHIGDEDILREHIEHLAGRTAEPFRAVIAERVQRASHILEFLEHIASSSASGIP